MDSTKRDEIISLNNYNKKNEDHKTPQILYSTSTPVSSDASKRINDSGYSTGKSMAPNTPSYHFLSRDLSFSTNTPNNSLNDRLKYRSPINSGPIPKFTLSTPNEEILGVASLGCKLRLVYPITPRSESEELRKRVVPRYGTDVGVKQIDFMKDLAQYSPVVSRIIGYLQDKDITNAKKVSLKWCKIISEHQNLRGSVSPIKSPEHVRKRRKPHATNDLRLPLLDIENQLGKVCLSEPLEIVQPKIQPSKINHQRFVEAAKKLLPCESLRKCPRCLLSPARITPIENRGRCVGINCQYDFCSICTTNFHGEARCPIQVPLDIEIEPSNSIRTIKSKKNLRRL